MRFVLFVFRLVDDYIVSIVVLWNLCNGEYKGT